MCSQQVNTALQTVGGYCEGTQCFGCDYTVMPTLWFTIPVFSPEHPEATVRAPPMFSYITMLHPLSIDCGHDVLGVLLYFDVIELYARMCVCVLAVYAFWVVRLYVFMYACVVHGFMCMSTRVMRLCMYEYVCLCVHVCTVCVCVPTQLYDFPLHPQDYTCSDYQCTGNNDETQCNLMFQIAGGDPSMFILGDTVCVYVRVCVCACVCNCMLMCVYVCTYANVYTCVRTD